MQNKNNKNYVNHLIKFNDSNIDHSIRQTMSLCKKKEIGIELSTKSLFVKNSLDPYLHKL